MTLREAYRQLMEHVAVTEEMRLRILANVQSASGRARRKKRMAPWIRYGAVAACAVLLAVSALTLPRLYDPAQSPEPSGVQSLPGRTELSTARELAQAVGFDVEEVSGVPFAVTQVQYAVYDGEMAEIKYCGETQWLTLRKIAGNTDPSGDYTAYPEQRVLEWNGALVILKGRDGVYYLAVWQNGGFSWAVKSSGGLSEADWETLLDSIGG